MATSTVSVISLNVIDPTSPLVTVSVPGAILFREVYRQGSMIVTEKLIVSVNVSPAG